MILSLLVLSRILPQTPGGAPLRCLARLSGGVA